MEPPAGPPNIDITASSSTGRLAQSAGIIGIATMASRVLGLVREQVLAFLFGAGREMDAFNVAFRLPNLLRDLFAEGAMSAAFVPAFTRELTSGGRAAAWRLGNQVINALIVVTGCFAVAGILVARPLVELAAADFSDIPGKLELTVSLTRVLFPFLVLVAVAAVCMGMLNSLSRFFVPALSPAMFNVASIALTVALVPVMPLIGLPRIMAVAIAALTGGLAQIAVQWPPLRREGFRYRPALDPHDRRLGSILMLTGPGLVGLAAVQINLIVNTVLATGEGEGAVSWLNYAFRLIYMPIGLFGVSIATAALPSLARDAARGETASMRRTLSGGIRMMLMLNVPATAGLMVLALPIVSLLFEHGSFGAADAAATASALVWYAPGLVGYSLVRLAVPTFYSQHDSRTAILVSVFAVGLNLVLNVALVRVLGYRGLAMGTSLAALAHALVLFWILRTRTGGLEGSRIAMTAAKISIATAVMAAAAWASDAALARLVAADLVSRLLRVGLDIGIALLVLAGAAHLLRIHEFREALRAVRARLSAREQRDV
jgi:putative peptidoglycan lipid II flippase